MQLIGNPLYDTITTGQLELTGAADQMPAQAGCRLVRVTADPGNAGVVYYGPSGVTASTGVPLPAGAAALVFLSDLSKLYAVGTAADVLAWEIYR